MELAIGGVEVYERLPFFLPAPVAVWLTEWALFAVHRGVRHY